MIAPALHEQSLARRLVGGFLLTDAAFAVLGPGLAGARDPAWRWGYYLVPSLYGWLLWQGFVLVGVLGAGFFPRDWSLEFMGTIALMVMVVLRFAARHWGQPRDWRLAASAILRGEAGRLTGRS